ncbi:uncharacterized protein PV07_01207 [Cladophialophora immunda]|uniref:Uncharacterized protein n=1 Tax=Cladophialophora immunda TaxID=569365 RepID=A0A0D2DFF5_9EURO|nr:uncharacterized protein PV07_01207 [Cladophialophora immunda]KIW34429.1 hypothetical protein PV07_01207 [Cladophialophora immunda]
MLLGCQVSDVTSRIPNQHVFQLGTLFVSDGHGQRRISANVKFSIGCHSFPTLLLSSQRSIWCQPCDQTRTKATAIRCVLLSKIPINRVNLPHHVQHGETESADPVCPWSSGTSGCMMNLAFEREEDDF